MERQAVQGSGVKVGVAGHSRFCDRLPNRMVPRDRSHQTFSSHVTADEFSVLYLRAINA